LTPLKTREPVGRRKLFERFVGLGQLVGAIFELALEAFPLGNVAGDRHDEPFTGPPIHRSQRQLDVDLLTRFSESWELERAPGIDEAPPSRVSVPQQPESVLRPEGRRHERFHGHANRFVLRIAEDQLRGRVPDHDSAGVRVRDDKPIANEVGEIADRKRFLFHHADTISQARERLIRDGASDLQPRSLSGIDPALLDGTYDRFCSRCDA
jgi:hypothetical protein